LAVIVVVTLKRHAAEGANEQLAVVGCRAGETETGAGASKAIVWTVLAREGFNR
jgi:hypothetical protein